MKHIDTACRILGALVCRGCPLPGYSLDGNALTLGAGSEWASPEDFVHIASDGTITSPSGEAITEAQAVNVLACAEGAP